MKLSKLKRAVLLSEERLFGHDDYSLVDPFVARTLVSILKYKKFKIDPKAALISKHFRAYYVFGYRITSKSIGGSNTIDCLTAYHEGIHNLVGYKYGTKLPGRPMLTLLNECLGVGTAIYFPAKMAQVSKVVHKDFVVTKRIIQHAKMLNVSFDKKMKQAAKDPFKAYRETVLEAYSIHKHIFEVLKKSIENKKISEEKIINDLNLEFKKAKNLLYYMDADLIVPAVFIACLCGLHSTKADRALTARCLKDLKTSNTMDEFFIKLGAQRILKVTA